MFSVRMIASLTLQYQLHLIMKVTSRDRLYISEDQKIFIQSIKSATNSFVKDKKIN